MGKYLADDILRGFDSYKYNSKDTSPFSNYVMHPFWNVFVKGLPLWLPANTMTFVGFLLLPLNFVVLSYYDFDFRANATNALIPRWVWLMCAFNNFMSHTLDGADGKQARRTGTSSALGELFDHGLDAWATTFFAIAIYDIFGNGMWGVSPVRMYMVVLAVQMTFISSHWEKYNTGVLYLPWGYDLALMGMTITYLITYVWGVEFWARYITIFGHTYTIAHVLEFCLYASNYGLSVPVCVYNVLNSYREKTGKMHMFTEAIRPLLPVVLMFPLFLIWVLFSRSNIIDNHPRCFFTLSGVLFANVTSRIIVNQMSGTRCDAYNVLTLPLLSIVPAVTLLDLGLFEVYLLYSYTAIALIAHIHYGYSVVHEMAEYLNIYVFSVETRPPRQKSS